MPAIAKMFEPYDPSTVREHKVYCIINRGNNFPYVGRTRYPLEHRWRGHMTEARRGSLNPLHVAIREYGAESFEKYVIASGLTEAEAIEMEDAYIVHFDAFADTGLGYNVPKGGSQDGSHARRKSSAMARSKAYQTDALQSWHNAKCVQQLDVDGNVIASFRSTKAAALATGGTQSGISQTCNGKQKVCGGFRWKYATEDIV